MGILKKLKLRLKLIRYHGKKLGEFNGKVFYSVRAKKNAEYGVIDNHGNMLYDMVKSHDNYFVDENFLFMAIDISHYDVVDLRTEEKIFTGVEVLERADRSNNIQSKPYYILKSSLSKLIGLFNPASGDFSGFSYDAIQQVDIINDYYGNPRKDVYIASSDGQSCVLTGFKEFIPMGKGQIQYVNFSNRFVRKKEDGRKIIYNIIAPNIELTPNDYNALEVDNIEIPESNIFPLIITKNNKVGLFDFQSYDDKIFDSSNYIYDEAHPYQTIIIDNPNKSAHKSGRDHFVKMRAAVKIDGKWGYIDFDKKEVIPCMFDKISDFDERHCATAVINKKQVAIDVDGKCNDEEISQLIDEYFTGHKASNGIEIK